MYNTDKRLDLSSRPAEVNAEGSFHCLKIIKFKLKYYVFDDGSKKRTVVCRVCSSKFGDMTSNFIRHPQRRERGL